MQSGELATDCSASATQRARGGIARPVWRETVVLTALVPLLGIGCGVRDPFGLHAELPWLALIPLLIGVQHGLVPALGSAAALCVGAWAHAGWVDAALPSAAISYAAATVMLAAIAGLGRDGMDQHHDNALRELYALRASWEQSQRAYQLLERSHDALVERLACEPASLQHALSEARCELARLHAWPALGHVLLRVLGEHAGVQAAVLHAWCERTGQLELAPAAWLGDAAPDAEGCNDPARVLRSPLVERALLSRRLVSWVDVAATDSSVRVAVPLLTSSGEVLGVIAVRELPFTHFEDGCLEDLFTLALALADPIAAQLKAAVRCEPAALVTSQGAPLPTGAATLRSRLPASHARVSPRADSTPRARPLASTQPWFTGSGARPARHAPPHGPEAAPVSAATERSASGRRTWGPVT